LKRAIVKRPINIIIEIKKLNEKISAKKTSQKDIEKRQIHISPSPILIYKRM